MEGETSGMSKVEGFGLPESDSPHPKKRRVNDLPYHEALKKAERNSVLVMAALNDLSLKKYSGRLQCEAAAGKGMGHRVELNRKAKENTILNRVRGGDNGMGVAIVCSDVVNGGSVVIHPRVRRSRAELSNPILTTESDCDGCCLLSKHWVMPVVVNRHNLPFLYGLYSVEELEGRGLLVRYEKRNTFVRVHLHKVPLRHFLGRQFGFGKRRDAVASVLRVLNK